MSIILVLNKWLLLNPSSKMNIVKQDYQLCPVGELNAKGGLNKDDVADS